MKSHRPLFGWLAVLTLLALLFPLAPAPGLLAATGVRSPPATVRLGPAEQFDAISALEADTEPPATVTDLHVSSGTSPGTVDLSWIAPGDDGTAGTAAGYTVRYNSVPIAEDNWAASTDVPGEPLPQPAGSVESMTVAGLAPGSAYHFALKAQDEVPNPSGVSNTPWARAASLPNGTFLPLTTHSFAEVPPVIPDTTRVLPASTTQYLTSVSSDGTLFTFSQSTPELLALEPGDIMVGDVADNAPYGFLRKVISVSPAGGQVIVDTADATLEEAIESGSLDVSGVLTPDDVQSARLAPGVTRAVPAQIEGGWYLLLDEVVLYDVDGDPHTTGDQIRANGSIRLEPQFDLRVKWELFWLKELSFIAGADETVDLRITAEVNQPDVDEEQEIARFYFDPFTIRIGGVPLVFFAVLTVNVGVDGSVSIGMNTEVTQEARLRAGLRYAKSSWRLVKEFSSSFDYSPPEFSQVGDLKGYADARLALLLYGVVGPYATLDAYWQFETGSCAVPWWKLYGGLEVPLGVTIEILSLKVASYEATAFDYRLALTRDPHDCSPCYPDVCIPPSLPGLTCDDLLPCHSFRVVGCDPYGFDDNSDGLGCNCSPCYPDVCIAPPPPELNCDDVPYSNFRVVGCDPHGFDADLDGLGCEWNP